MDIGVFQQFLQEYVQEAYENSDGTPAGILSYLRDKQVRKGWFKKHSKEKSRALDMARLAFEDHRHWPLQIIVSHLGVELKGLEDKK